MIAFSLRACLFSLAMYLGGASLHAQPEREPQQELKSESADSIAPATIEITEMTEAFTVSNALLNDANDRSIREEDIQAYVRRVDSIFTGINQFLRDTSQAKLKGLDLTELQSLTQRAGFYLGELEKLKEILSSRAEELNATSGALKEDRDRWGLTLLRIPPEEITEERVRRIEHLLAALDSVRVRLIDDLGSILEQEDRLADKVNELEQMKSLLAKQENILVANLFKKEQPPLLRCGKQEADTALFVKHVRQISDSFRTDLDIMRNNYRVQMAFAGGFFLLLLLFAFWYRRHFRHTYSGTKFKVSKVQLALIRSPLVVSIFITGALIRIVFPDLPRTFYQLNFVVFMIPMLIIVIRIFGKELRNWFSGLSILYLFTFFYELTYDPDPLMRVTILLFTLAALFLFVWIYVKKPDSFHFRSVVVERLLRLLLGILIILLLTALAANFLGAFNLAEFFTLLPIQIVLLAVGVQIATKIVDTLVFMLLISRFMQKINVIRDDLDFIYRKVVGMLDLLLWFFFFTTALAIFRIKDGFYAWLIEFMTRGIKVGEAEVSLWSVTLFILVIWLSIVITRMVRHILEKDVFSRVQTAKGIPTTVSLLVRVSMLSAGFFLAAAAAGIKLSNLSIILGAFSVGIGFGLQNIFNNMVSGLILALERPIKVGDVVQVGELMGVVKSIGLRSSNIKSFDGAEVIVPNGNLISQEMVNWTLSDSNRRMDIRVGVAYGTKPSGVVELMQEVAESHEKVDKTPPPTAYFIGFGDSSLNFRLLAWTDIDSRLKTESELNMAIEEKLNDAGIEIPFPQVDLNIRRDDTAFRKPGKKQ